MVNKARNLLIMLNNLEQMHLKLLQGKNLRKRQKQLVILIGNRIADKSTKFSKILRQNSSEKSTNETENIESDKNYVKKEIYISRAKTENYL